MTTWVFLRGLTREARHWGDFPARFRTAFAEAWAEGDLLTPDLPGNGQRFMEPSPCSVEAMLEACRHDLREQGKPPPYHLLALSLGGMVAVAWATRHPEECQAAVLLSTSLRPWNPFYQRLRPGAYPTLLRQLLLSGTAREQAILELTSAHAEELRQVLPNWTAWARECPVSRRNTLRQLLAAARFSAVAKPDVPLLILAAAGDRMVHPRCSQRLAQAWNADFVLHPSAGHDLPLDDGDWVAREVKTFVTALRRSQSNL
ncbi:MAG: alpha/beta hydrolase [Pseudomonadota bacterium]|nr:alpha/beta hydrolase [Pseudomonadota bacterium]